MEIAATIKKVFQELIVPAMDFIRIDLNCGRWVKPQSQAIDLCCMFTK